MKGRIEQTVQSQEGCITTFRLASLIQFYRVVMDRTIGSRAALSRTLADVSLFAYQAFLGTLDNLAAGLQRFQEVCDVVHKRSKDIRSFDKQSPDSDLGPPAPLIGACVTLKELLHAHQISLSESDLFGDSLPLKDVTDTDGSATDFSKVIQRFIEPLSALWIRMSLDIVQKRPRGKSEEDGQWDTQLFVINCVGYVKSILESYQFAEESLSQLDQDMQKRLQDLVVAHHKRLCIESGLGKGLVEEKDEQVTQALDSFEDFLSSPHLLASPRLNLLNVPARRLMVQQHALARLANDYDTLVLRERDSHTARKSPEELRILLGIPPSFITD